MEIDAKSPMDVVQHLAALGDGWNGPGSLAATEESVASAGEFASALVEAATVPTVGLSEDGEFLFEWQFPGSRSIFVRVAGSTAEVIAMDESRDLMEISLSPCSAAAVALGVVADWSTTSEHRAA